MKRSVRSIAAGIILALQNQQSNLDALLRKHHHNLDESERRLLQALCYGMCREWFHIAAIEKALLDRPLKPRDQILSAIIRCGIYELGWMGSKPHAVVSEYVDVAVLEGRPWARGLVNAVLRGFIRKKSELKMERHDAETLWNHPDWLIKAIQEAWPLDWERILVENNVHPPMTLRVNVKQISRDAYLETLIHAGIDAVPGTAPTSIRLEHAQSVQQLPGFADGWFSVQDESSQWAASILAPVDGERILDACAAPGGKACHLLESADIQLLALDISEQRLAKVKENLVRLGLRAQVKASDACALDSWWDHDPFDAVLLDLPCSATGVIRRHPDVRLMRSADALKSLSRVQANILDACWTTVADGGRMLVTTCSILPRENDDQIEAFLERHDDARVQPILQAPGRMTKHGIQQLPDHGSGDGFYYAMLVKSGSHSDRESA